MVCSKGKAKVKKDAVLSKCRKYRFALWRIWDESKPQVMFIGLNPSTADEIDDDPTLIRCINYAKAWGFGGICMTNLFAYRATEPQDMLTAHAPVGSENDQWLINLSKKAGLVVAAWGNTGTYLNRSSHIKQLIPNLNYLKLNQSGEPAHPLYLKSSLKPVPLCI